MADLDLTKEMEQQEAELPAIIESERNKAIQLAKQSPEVQAIIRQVDVMKPNTIVTFGANSADEISKFSDAILHSMEATKSEDAGKMIARLNKIMDKFDIKDFAKENQGLLSKLFHSARNSVEEMFNRYHTMGDEVDKIYITLKEFETDIEKNNRGLEDMFDKNVSYYQELQRYIVAGEMAIEELKTSLIPQWEEHAKKTGQQTDELTVQNLRQALSMMEQRVYDLKLAENVALQSMPLIKSIEFGNYNLVRKINSAFIITLPIFKQALAQSIMLRRQALQAQAMKALDEKTNELLLRNAENTAAQTKATAMLASSSFVEIETLEKTWSTIMKGIEETKQIQADAEQKRADGSKKLQEFKQAYDQKKMLITP